MRKRILAAFRSFFGKANLAGHLIHGKPARAAFFVDVTKPSP
jgi:hypothetical protein